MRGQAVSFLNIGEDADAFSPERWIHARLVILPGCKRPGISSSATESIVALEWNWPQWKPGQGVLEMSILTIIHLAPAHTPHLP
jgi:hypothetical protein